MDSYTGDQIFDALTRSKAPEERLKKLNDAGLDRLKTYIDQLPAGIGPRLFGAMATAEVVRRWREAEQLKATTTLKPATLT